MPLVTPNGDVLVQELNFEVRFSFFVIKKSVNKAFFELKMECCIFPLRNSLLFYE